MKLIRIKELRIINFKGISAFKLDFSTEGNNTIFGANGTGKTSIFDAFTWLLFNKNSQGKSDFEIKPLDKNNNIIHNLAVEVYAELLIDNEVIQVRKVLKEKWTKKRGSETAEFTGNETDYYFNKVPKTQKEFQAKIDNIVDENIFKIITNPKAFVSLKWESQRQTLLEIANIPSDKEIASGDLELENLIAELGTSKTLEELVSQTKHSIKKAKDEVDTIPARIEELNRSLPVPIVEKNVQANIENLNNEINKIDEQISNKMALYDDVIDKRNANQKAIQALQSKVNDIEFKVQEEAKSKALTKNPLELEYNTLISEFKTREEEISALKNKITNVEGDIQQLERYRDELRNEWEEVNAREFKLNPDDTICSTCGQELKNADGLQSELKYKFNTKKQSELKVIQEKGGGYKSQQEAKEESRVKYNLDLSELQTTNAQLELKIEQLNDKIKLSDIEGFDADKFITESLLANVEYNILKGEIAKYQALKFETPTEDIAADLKIKKQQIQDEIIKLNGYLQENNRIKETNKRIEELQNIEQEQNQIICQYERKIFLIEKFNKKKIDMLDESVNKMFSMVKFKLFDVQINGGIKDTCEATVEGVPYSNLNTASQINAGLDVINTLAAFYKVQAPIFIDNSESVHTLINSHSQLIRLVVSEQDSQLTLK
jgi:chromosome segregation ATPase